MSQNCGIDILVLFPNLRGKAFSFSLLSMMLAAGLFTGTLWLRNSLLFLVIKCFLTPIMKRCWIQKCFFCEPRCVFLSFILLKWHNVDWLSYNEPTLPINPMWSWYIIFYMLLDFVCQYFVEDSCLYIHKGYQLCVCVTSLSDIGIRNTGITLPAMWGKKHVEWRMKHCWI